MQLKIRVFLYCALVALAACIHSPPSDEIHPATTLIIENSGIDPVHLWVTMDGQPWWESIVTGKSCLPLHPAEIGLMMSGENGANSPTVPKPMSAASVIIMPPVTVLAGDGWTAKVDGDGGIYSLQMSRSARCRT